MTHQLFDPKCYELAEQFLPDGFSDETKKKHLAATIQDAIEQWLSDAEWERQQKEMAGSLWDT